ncbi:hypothetical protein KGM_214527 [Danaus plexippus plexippus]|uniref:Uncharacterized protein n=1 Tax=Danaus plexippus plexippus TaxID=278856 RepID=A0A212ES01_DANPL|nr:hypothetical protein KGM_214527 [Danaus plexippus plexippus]
MKFSLVCVLLMSVFMLFITQSSANPKVNFGAIVSIKKGLGVLSAAGMAENLYEEWKHKHGH